MEEVQLRQKRGLRDSKVRRSYSCTDLSMLLDPDRVSDGESDGGNGGGGSVEGDNEGGSVTVPAPKRHGSERKKGSVHVISSPVPPSSLQSRGPRMIALPQHIKSMNFSNPFGTIGRRNKRKGSTPVITLTKCFGPPPPPPSTTTAPSASILPALFEQQNSLNPFCTLPRNAAKRLGLGTRESRSSSFDGLHLPFASPLLRTAGEDPNSLMCSHYQRFLGKSMDKVG